MSGRKLRKEGYLYAKLVESPTAMRRLTAATLKTPRHGFETWRNAHITLRFNTTNSFSLIKDFIFLRVDRLNIYSHKSDMAPTLSYTLV